MRCKKCRPKDPPREMGLDGREGYYGVDDGYRGHYGDDKYGAPPPYLKNYGVDQYGAKPTMYDGYRRNYGAPPPYQENYGVDQYGAKPRMYDADAAAERSWHGGGSTKHCIRRWSMATGHNTSS